MFKVVVYLTDGTAAGYAVACFKIEENRFGEPRLLGWDSDRARMLDCPLEDEVDRIAVDGEVIWKREEEEEEDLTESFSRFVASLGNRE